MYITYETPQWRIEHLRGELSRPLYSNPPHRRFVSLQSSTGLKPRWLVRVLDMAIVRGSGVNEEYCILSYARSQSGDIVNDRRIDTGDHRIISYAAKDIPVTQRVRFEGIIQQMCKDFNVNYIWYDQMCMDRSDPEQVQSAYSYAYYTIALIPELRVDKFEGSFPDIGEIEISEWWKDSSSIKQAAMSQRLLFVGSNVHMWWYTIAFSNMWATKYERIFLSIFNTMLKPVPAPKKALPSQLQCTSTKILVAKMNASKILWQVHRHKNAYEKIFVLANMYPNIMGEIKNSYEQPLADLMKPLYKLLDRMDISILLFGRPDSDEAMNTGNPQDPALFPSWAGFNGVHVPQLPMSNRPIRTVFNNFKIDGSSMHIISGGVPVSITSSCSPDESEVSALDDIYDEDDEEWSAPVKVTFSSSNSLQFYPMTDRKLWRVTNLYGLRATHWLPIRKEAEAWINASSSPNYAGGYLSLTDESCTQCTILSDIGFYTDSTHIRAYPVVKQEEAFYKSVGLCFSFNLKSLNSYAPEATDIILQ